jgi:hypothetical protein
MAGADRDDAKAVELFKYGAQFNLGLCYGRTWCMAKAAEWYRKAAQKWECR